MADHDAVMALYRALSSDPRLPEGAAAEAQLVAILDHPGTLLFGSVDGGEVRAMCTLHILPNMTRGARPYALIENVVTAPGHRRKGHARRAMQAAIGAAWQADCYKVMLLSGSEDGRGFYPTLGFDGTAKQGFVLRRP